MGYQVAEHLIAGLPVERIVFLSDIHWTSAQAHDHALLICRRCLWGGCHHEKRGRLLLVLVCGVTGHAFIGGSGRGLGWWIYLGWGASSVLR